MPSYTLGFDRLSFDPVIADEIAELCRLSALLPLDLRPIVAVTSVDQLPALPIATQATDPGKFSIQIDPQQWARFTSSQRDLLFWHEVALIQGRCLGRGAWEPTAIAIGLLAALAELPSHSLLAFAVALTVAGLATYKLYQNHWGEQNLRKFTTADQGAIALALAAGYSVEKAYRSLSEAVILLMQQSKLKAYRRQYQVRLRVLEIMAAKG
jgi:Protein of unknown function (DUF3318)